MVQNLSAPHTELANESSQLKPDAHAPGATLRDRCIRWLEEISFAAIAVLVIAIPHPTAVVLYAFRAIWLLWTVRLLLGKNHLRLRPLYLPIVIFVTLVFLSTVHSYEPLLSWDRIERFTEMLIVLPIAENLRSLRRMKLLIVLLLAAPVAAQADPPHPAVSEVQIFAELVHDLHANIAVTAQEMQ